MEMHSLKPYYQNSEIWVGTESDVGAQISVPSVRGDKVLWMCGDHQRAAGVVETRDIAEKGAFEPCDQGLAQLTAQTAAAKAKAKAKKTTTTTSSAKVGGGFGVLRDVARSMDTLVMGPLRRSVAHLGGLAERSDVMFAVYDGGGARFQRHIDNTAKDGRKLTAVLYLNPSWKVEHGGALRVHPVEGAGAGGAGVGGAEEDAATAGTGATATAGAGATAAGAGAVGEGTGQRKCIDNDGKGVGKRTPPSVTNTLSELTRLDHAVDLYPEGGRLVLFFSDVVAHEVLPSHAARHALTIWFYDDDERTAAVAGAAKQSAGGAGDGGEAGGKGGGGPGFSRSFAAGVAGEAQQLEAKNFIASLLQQSEFTKAGIAAMAETARTTLSPASVSIVTSVLGMGYGGGGEGGGGRPETPEDVEAAILAMEPEDLRNLRQGLERMGL